MDKRLALEGAGLSMSALVFFEVSCLSNIYWGIPPHWLSYTISFALGVEGVARLLKSSRS